MGALLIFFHKESRVKGLNHQWGDYPHKETAKWVACWTLIPDNEFK